MKRRPVFGDRPGSGRDPLGRYDLPTLILRRRSGRGGCPARLREVIIPKKEVIIRAKNEISRRITEVIISSIWTADLFPDGPLDAEMKRRPVLGIGFRAPLYGSPDP